MKDYKKNSEGTYIPIFEITIQLKLHPSEVKNQKRCEKNKSNKKNILKVIQKLSEAISSRISIE